MRGNARQSIRKRAENETICTWVAPIFVTIAAVGAGVGPPADFGSDTLAVSVGDEEGKLNEDPVGELKWPLVGCAVGSHVGSLLG